MLTTTGTANRSRPGVPGLAKVKAMAAAAIGGGLVLLCACATQTHTTVPPTHQPPTGTTAVPSSETLDASTDAASPSPTPDIGPPDASLTSSLIVTDTDASVADLEVTVSGAAQVTPGDTGTYTLTIRNHGPAPATGIVLTNVLPHGMNPVWTEPGRSVCGRQERSVGCDFGELRPGTALTITLDLSLGGSETLVTSTQLAGVTVDPPVPSCVIGEDRTRPNVTCSLARLLPGANAQVRIGIGAANYVSASLVHTSTVEANEADEDYANNRAVLTNTVDAVGPVPVETGWPGTATLLTPTTDLVLQATAPSTVIAGQPFTFAFTITNKGTTDVEGVVFENAVPPATILNGFTPGLPPCEWQDDSSTCYLRDLATGGSVTVTLAVTGHSGQPLFIWLDQLMPGWPMCYLLKERDYLHIVVCELGLLRPGQTSHIRVSLTAMGLQERLMVNSASVSAADPDLNTISNTSTTTITVQAKADLAVWSAVSGPAPVGGTFSYTLTIANLGPSDAADVLLTDTLPMGTSLVSVVPSLGVDCSSGPGRASSDTMMCGAGRLNSGETATVTVTVSVSHSLVPEPAESIVHSVRVTSNQVDPDAGNNEMTEYIAVSTGTEE